MGDTNGRKIAHMLKRITWHRKKSSKKHENAIERYILTLRKEEKLGADDRWVKITKNKAIDRLRKMGTTPQQVKDVLENRTYKHLSSKVDF
ncbi:hypothetical protein AGMMS50249_7720 [candidate division SR1 bacterium]|nr:hypothetical protein AGMMS50249_7720 [candidate division SR1 bacterium]